MNFFEWHAPVPLAHEAGVFERALKFLLNMQIGSPVRRINWTMTINPRLDTSPENYHKWGKDRTTVTPENVGKKVHLRVEMQGLFRLPRSNAIMFSIRGYLMSLEQIVTVPKWGTPAAAGSSLVAGRTRRLQSPRPIPRDGDRLAVEIRRRRADLTRRRPGLTARADRDPTRKKLLQNQPRQARGKPHVPNPSAAAVHPERSPPGERRRFGFGIVE